MIGSILVANRGEIAVRIAGTAREMGIQSVSLHMEAEQDSLHVTATDASIMMPGVQVSDTYLNILVRIMNIIL